MSNPKVKEAEIIEILSNKDEQAVDTIKTLNIVKVVVVYDIEHEGKRYPRGEKLTLPRESADYHINNGNCEIVK